jgi:hypothetical protein
MVDIVTDFAAIAKIANLKALDGRPQDDVTAGVPKVETAPEPQADDPYGMYAGYVDRSAEALVWSFKECRYVPADPTTFWQENLYGPALADPMDSDVVWSGEVF